MFSNRFLSRFEAGGGKNFITRLFTALDTAAGVLQGTCTLFFPSLPGLSRFFLLPIRLCFLVHFFDTNAPRHTLASPWLRYSVSFSLSSPDYVLPVTRLVACVGRWCGEGERLMSHLFCIALSGGVPFVCIALSCGVPFVCDLCVRAVF